MRERVTDARLTQSERLRGVRLLRNADLGSAEVRRFYALDGVGQRLMQAATCQPQLSARGYHRVLKLARTIFNLANVLYSGLIYPLR